ncbi:DUF222 domain-containing protein [Microbispora sp. RL4-1S]|uniref:DUF222 domain-containing protein n=1 Tax=Microbispora oryzae TaxID=2806554 RepID=A0A940WQK6_9ACTN|nr:DUF222 domain-containing protein [Microbispora oryzae]MBP2707752.1 DUF222 domain-containing protein [Microbispora oryzae]
MNPRGGGFADDATGDGDTAGDTASDAAGDTAGDTAGDMPGDAADDVDIVLELAARMARRQRRGGAVVCLPSAEKLIQAIDLLSSVFVAQLHQAHVTGEAKAYGHASTASWLRSTRPSTPAPGTPAPGATASGAAETGAGAPGAPVVVRRGPGMTGAQASRWLRISGEVARLPLVKARYRDGSLSGGAVDAITTVTAKLADKQAEEAEQILVQLSDSASCAEVAKAGRYIREILDPGTLVQECEDDYASRFLLVRPSSTGGVEGEFRLPREAAARLRSFLTSYARPKDKDDDRPLRVRQADAFAALLSKKVSTELLVLVRAESIPDDILIPTGTPKAPPAGTRDAPPAGAQEAGSTAEPTGTDPDPPNASADAALAAGAATAEDVATAATANADPDADARAEEGTAGARADACRTCGHAPDRLAPGLLVATGQLLPVSDVHRLARTSRLTRMVMDAKGQVLDMGRSVRLATPAQRKALLAQYATCYCQGCPIPATMAEVDHVNGWIDDGVTNLDLLAPACTFHNRDKFAHPERYTARRNPYGTWTLLHHPNRRSYERGTRQPRTDQVTHPPG